MDLGRKPKSIGSLAAPATSPEQPKITYPGFSLSDEHAKKFSEEFSPKLGEEYAATVRLKVVSLTADEYGERVQFDVIELDDIAEEGEEKTETEENEGSGSGSGAGESEDEDNSEEKVLGYKRKVSKKEAPDTSAKSLED